MSPLQTMAQARASATAENILGADQRPNGRAESMCAMPCQDTGADQTGGWEPSCTLILGQSLPCRRLGQ